VISHRYVPAICALLLLALIPTIIHSYSPVAGSDDLVVETIPVDLARFTSVRSDRNATWGKRRFDSDNWVEREYRDPARGGNVTLTVIQTYDAKSVYHHPELAVVDGAGFVDKDIVRLPERPDIPVHVLKPGPGVSASAAYVLHYGTGFVADPIAFQIRSAGEMLFRRRRPMTLFFAFHPTANSDGPSSSPTTTVLFAAIDAFLKTGS
jgi:hypothetical protein